MTTIWHQQTDDFLWDERVFKRDGHFLQSSHWAAFQRANGREVRFGEGGDWQCMTVVERAGDACRLYCPYGPVADDRAGLAAATEALRDLGCEVGADFIRAEPWVPVGREVLAGHGYEPARRSMQPDLTWVQDLAGRTREQVIGEFSANNRNRFRNAHKKNLTVTAGRDPADVEILLGMLHDVADNTGIRQHADDYYRRQAATLLSRDAATLYVVRHEGDPVGAALVYDSPTTRYYAHSGTLAAARSLHPGTVLLATMILDARDGGQDLFDFVGAAPAGDPDHPWAGFTRFKQSFGGRYRQYLGTWEFRL
ncbi:lipid II:glycine glycyltransferase FemX [Actinoplanes xinjiangensis]|uniref:lipid II:glycine glycyltransferase FemX n=1 Tax=Actinoplanes xinjiangensis TaxID=512350 RepID=UPI003446A8FD